MLPVSKIILNFVLVKFCHRMNPRAHRYLQKKKNGLYRIFLLHAGKPEITFTSGTYWVVNHAHEGQGPKSYWNVSTEN